MNIKTDIENFKSVFKLKKKKKMKLQWIFEID